jgi:hypothetical protein
MESLQRAVGAMMLKTSNAAAEGKAKKRADFLNHPGCRSSPGEREKKTIR